MSEVMEAFCFLIFISGLSGKDDEVDKDKSLCALRTQLKHLIIHFHNITSSVSI